MFLFGAEISFGKLKIHKNVHEKKTDQKVWFFNSLEPKQHYRCTQYNNSAVLQTKNYFVIKYLFWHYLEAVNRFVAFEMSKKMSKHTSRLQLDPELRRSTARVWPQQEVPPE